MVHDYDGGGERTMRGKRRASKGEKASCRDLLTLMILQVGFPFTRLALSLCASRTKATTTVPSLALSAAKSKLLPNADGKSKREELRSSTHF
jgi:hypothetical protein